MYVLTAHAERRTVFTIKTNGVLFESKKEEKAMLILFGALAFVLEVVAWVALARWGWQIHPLLAAAFPLAFILFWGAFL